MVTLHCRSQNNRAQAPQPLKTLWLERADTDSRNCSLPRASHITIGSSIHWPELDPALDPVLEIQVLCDLK